MRKGAQSAYARQASAFAGTANVYAPYYRQLDAVYALTLPADQHVAAISGAPTADVTAAFAYYIDHCNGGRPSALVAHSQGSDVATHLLAGYLKAHPDIAQRMIVAYVIGYSVTQAYLDANPHLRFASSAADTGVIVSPNTEAPTIGALNPVMLPGALAISPITWTRGADVVPGSLSKGAWLPHGVPARRASHVRLPVLLLRPAGELPEARRRVPAGTPLTQGGLPAPSRPEGAPRGRRACPSSRPPGTPPPVSRPAPAPFRNRPR
jgi:hypothetical protein